MLVFLTYHLYGPSWHHDGKKFSHIEDTENRKGLYVIIIVVYDMFQYKSSKFVKIILL